MEMKQVLQSFPLVKLLVWLVLFSTCRAFAPAATQQQHPQQNGRHQQSSRLIVGATLSSGPPSATAASLLDQETARSLAQEKGENDTIERAKVEEKLLTTSGAPRDELQEATNEERQAAVKANKKFWKEQQRLVRNAKASSKKSTGETGAKKGFGNKPATPTLDANEAQLSSSSVEEHTGFNPKLDPDGYAAILRVEGVARKNQALSKETTTALRDFLDAELARSLDDIAAGKISPQSRFARVLLKENRWDMSLPLEQEEHGADIVMQALWELLGDGQESSGAVGNIIESALTPNAMLHEFSCLISDPGSDRQVLHPDVPHPGHVRNGPPFVTCFCAVQDVERDMGPTEFLPRTNTLEAHVRFHDVDLRDDLLREAPTKLSLLNEGDCSLYDTTTLHAGTANRSQKRRRIFYFTFRSTSTGDDRTKDEPGSIRGDVLERRLSLTDLRLLLSKWKSKTGN